MQRQVRIQDAYVWATIAQYDSQTDYREEIDLPPIGLRIELDEEDIAHLKAMESQRKLRQEMFCLSWLAFGCVMLCFALGYFMGWLRA